MDSLYITDIRSSDFTEYMTYVKLDLKRLETKKQRKN